jgi:hypothetical protein
MAYWEQFSLKELRQKISSSRRYLGLASAALRSAERIERMADKEDAGSQIHPISDLVDPHLMAMKELWNEVETIVEDDASILCYKYIIYPGRPKEYHHVSWVETTGTMVFTARDEAGDSLADVWDDVIRDTPGNLPDKVAVSWINAKGIKNYFQIWDNGTDAWTDASSGLFADGSGETLEVSLDNWDANEDLLSAATAAFSADPANWDVSAAGSNYDIDEAVNTLKISTGAVGELRWTWQSGQPKFRHGHLYKVSYSIHASTVFSDPDTWFRFKLGDTVGRKHMDTSEVGTTLDLTEYILAEADGIGSDIVFAIEWNVESTDLIWLSSVQIQESFSDELDVTVELISRDSSRA